MQSLWTLPEPHQHSRNPSQVSAVQQCQKGASEQSCSKVVNCCSVRTTRMPGMNAKNFDEVFGTLIAQGISPEALFESVCKQVCHMRQPFAKLCVNAVLCSQVPCSQSPSIYEWASMLANLATGITDMIFSCSVVATHCTRVSCQLCQSQGLQACLSVLPCPMQ